MKSINSTVGSLQQIYVIILALAVAEAFMQFVTVATENTQDTNIQFERLVPLISFLFLVVPFYHGMSRFFFDMYQESQIKKGYGRWLIFDCCIFTIEAGLFFVLARSMPKEIWFQFILTVVVLLCVDIFWGAVTWWRRTEQIRSWVIINFIAAPILGTILYIYRNNASWFAISFTTIVIVTRTVADYLFCSSLYFPEKLAKATY